METCSICGELIPDDELTWEHTPPKLFHPKAIRPEIKGQLWTVPSHRGCNEKYRMDEEYLYYFLAGMVFSQNPEMGQILLNDIRDRAKNPQTRGLIRRFLKEAKSITSGGIHLPPGISYIQPDMVRVQNVVLKIAQCIYFKDHTKHLPRTWCKHIEICQTPQDIQPLFELMVHAKPVYVMPKVFSYRHLYVDGTHLYSLLFWEGFMFCLAFEDPDFDGVALSSLTRNRKEKVVTASAALDSPE